MAMGKNKKDACSCPYLDSRIWLPPESADGEVIWGRIGSGYG